MSTTLLVLLAILTAVASVGVLWFLRWQEQQRLHRARQTLVHTDAIGEVSIIGEALMPWLSREALTFLMNQVHDHHQRLQMLNAPADKRVQRGLAAAAVWADHAFSATPLPSDGKKAQEVRHFLQRFNEYLKNSYRHGSVAEGPVKALLNENRTLNVRLAVTVYESRAKGALNLSNPLQARRWYKKAQAALKQLEPLPESLTSAAQSIEEALQTLASATQAAQSGTRLVEEAEALAAEDEAWKKKHF